MSFSEQTSNQCQEQEAHLVVVVLQELQELQEQPLEEEVEVEVAH